MWTLEWIIIIWFPWIKGDGTDGMTGDGTDGLGLY